MKRKLGVWLLLLMLLTGCGSAPVQQPPEETAAADQETEASEVIPAIALEPALQLTTEEEILSAYDQALEAWRWFSTEPLPHGEESRRVDGQAYWNVLSHRFQTMKDLRNHLEWLFSQELTEQLLEEEAELPPYREIDGTLYVRDGLGTVRERRKGKQQFQVEQETDTQYSVNITVDLLDEYTENVMGLEFWSFPYELRTDRWVFTDFALVDG